MTLKRGEKMVLTIIEDTRKLIDYTKWYVGGKKVSSEEFANALRDLSSFYLFEDYLTNINGVIFKRFYYKG